MHPLLSQLISRPPVLTDGAWGTLLQSLGLPPGECPDAWNITHPALVADAARQYVDAGSDIILTNTFRSNRIALAPYGLARHAGELNRLGVEISRRAAGTRAKVFASVGPSGKMLMAGDVTQQELEGAFSEQADAIAAAGADGIVIETMADLEEATIALKAAKATGLPVVVSMVFDSGKERDRTMMGATPEQVAEELEGLGADVIGANCGAGIEGYIPVCTRLRGATRLPVWIKPNAGLPTVVEGSITYTMTPDHFARLAPALRDAGATFIGGCCGTTPDFVRALRRTLS